MSESEVEPSTSIAQVLEGGLPQLLLGPAGKALSRLIGAAVEIPAGLLDEQAQKIKDRTEARSKVMQSIAAKAAELAVADPAVMERGLHSLLGKAYREQENREDVAKKAAEHLQADPPPADSEGPSDDWMNVFEDRAAKASSEDLRELLSRILAGEVRRPGSFSLSTMHLISILDQPTAQKLAKLAPYVWDGSTVLKTTIDAVLPYSELLELEDIGLITTGAGMLTVQKEATPTGMVGFFKESLAVVGHFEGPNKRSFPAYSISRSARELIAVMDAKPDVLAVAKALWAAGAKKVELGHVLQNGEDHLFRALKEIPKP